MNNFRIPLLILIASVTALLGGQANASTVGATGNYTSNGSAAGIEEAFSGSGTATFDSTGTMTVIAHWRVLSADAATTKVYTGSLNGSTWTSDGNFVITYKGCSGYDGFAVAVCNTMGGYNNLPQTNSGTVTPFSLNICTGGPDWPETDTTPYDLNIGNKGGMTATSTNSVAVVDADSDCVADVDDFYPNISLNGRTDTDRDGMPDNCDATCNLTGMLADDDDDGDGFIDTGDRCPLIVNPGQEDSDSDMVGDLCDNCPSASNADQLNTEGDAQGDACDPDDDNDGQPDTGDNCPLVANPDQLNTEGDAQGNACDPDDDNDGQPDTGDNCPLVANPDQADGDNDRIGDVCDLTVDPDTDGDSVPDNVDNCPAKFNPNQADSDNNGVGNKCEPDYVPPVGC